MKHEDVRLGSRVVPHSKTAEGRTLGLFRSAVWNKAIKDNKPYVYVTYKSPKGAYPECVLSTEKDINDGDYFTAFDFEKYKK